MYGNISVSFILNVTSFAEDVLFVILIYVWQGNAEVYPVCPTLSKTYVKYIVSFVFNTPVEVFPEGDANVADNSGNVQFLFDL